MWTDSGCGICGNPEPFPPVFFFRVRGADLRGRGEGHGGHWHTGPRGVDAVLGAVRGAERGLPTGR